MLPKPCARWPRPRARSRDASATFPTMLEDDPDTVLIYEQYRDAEGAGGAPGVGALQEVCRRRALPEDAGAERGEPGCSRLSPGPRPTGRKCEEGGKRHRFTGDSLSGDHRLLKSIDRAPSGLPSVTIMPIATMNPGKPVRRRMALALVFAAVLGPAVFCRQPPGGMPRAQKHESRHEIEQLGRGVAQCDVEVEHGGHGQAAGRRLHGHPAPECCKPRSRRWPICARGG